MTKVEIIIKADELTAAITKLVVALESKQIEELIEVSAESTVTEKEEKLVTAMPKAEPPKEEPITIERVRAVLAEKSQSGKQPEVKALITKFGAKKLTAIDPAHYAELLKEAGAL